MPGDQSDLSKELDAILKKSREIRDRSRELTKEVAVLRERVRRNRTGEKKKKGA